MKKLILLSCAVAMSIAAMGAFATGIACPVPQTMLVCKNGVWTMPGSWNTFGGTTCTTGENPPAMKLSTVSAVASSSVAIFESGKFKGDNEPNDFECTYDDNGTQLVVQYLAPQGFTFLYPKNWYYVGGDYGCTKANSAASAINTN